ncbi:hypothetical protein A3A20_00840 [Candidatus Wolfebacteria bacterium RIFCSPLOWO2_01_FULL_45_19]|uniref:Uncharacterized protein n=1 Tax=Candidatus Wolfebacteria bacterium RIFCSPLOWO2_01_FULL_45_19 TaxID=1802557 RepID=A0A1F8DPV2_9BACT|nr:MAG: hypothetical protein UX23_C0009G0026 [Parcubacteria group bacterium GW2011_GWB1_45_9]OGM90640.1 MAG: hypothetical protein A3A20_00840 [Candidatus Wolfebacteria bacterium RIFCSPLOWO2_01_FULL_45_19]
MYNFILQLIIFASLGAIIYVIARALPRVEGEDINSNKRLSLLDSVFSSKTLDKADVFVKVILEKILRRMKIIVMRADNFVSENLGKIKENGDKPDGF